MLQRLDAMESELTTLIGALRTGSNRLNADLQLLEGNFDEVRGSVGSRAHFENEPAAAEPELDDPEPEAMSIGTWRLRSTVGLRLMRISRALV